VIPTGQVELIVRYGDPFVHVAEDGVVQLPAASLLGPRTRPVLAAATGSTGLVIAALHPWASGVLLRGDLPTLTDRWADLDARCGRARTTTLVDRVATARRPEERARVVEAFLGDLLGERAVDRLAIAADRIIRGRAGRFTASDLAAELGVGERQLRRRVVAAVGLGPKRLARLARAQAALAGLRRGRGWAEVAQDLGYADQSHLIREIKAFTGRTPGRLPGLDEDTPLMRSFNDGAAPLPATVYL